MTGSTPLTKSPVALLVKLLDVKLIKKTPLGQPDHSRIFNLKAWCAYHFDALGHHTNRCFALKHKIQYLIDKGVVKSEYTVQNPFIYHVPSQRTPLNFRDELALLKQDNVAMSKLPHPDFKSVLIFGSSMCE